MVKPQIRAIRNGFHWYAHYLSAYWGAWIEIPNTEADTATHAIDKGFFWLGLGR